jgi:hypothetical protein
MVMLLAVLIAQMAPGGIQQSMRVPSPPAFVAFTAELRITHPTRPAALGRYVQDEHGCTRRETVNTDGSLIVTINNFEAARTYSLMRGSWTSQEIRLIPGLPRRPRTMRVDRPATPVEGFDTYLSSVTVKSSRGDYIREATVAPALNFFEVVQTLPNGDTISAQNIRLGAPDHAEFLPPPGAAIGERPGVRAGQFSAVVVAVTFENRGPVELTTTEERPMDLRTPMADTIQIVTTVVDDAKNLVRVRIMKNAASAGIGNVKGDLLDDVLVQLGGTVRTTKLPENFSVTITRIRDRWADKQAAFTTPSARWRHPRG